MWVSISNVQFVPSRRADIPSREKALDKIQRLRLPKDLQYKPIHNKPLWVWYTNGNDLHVQVWETKSQRSQITCQVMKMKSTCACFLIPSESLSWLPELILQNEQSPSGCCRRERWWPGMTERIYLNYLHPYMYLMRRELSWERSWTPWFEPWLCH